MTIDTLAQTMVEESAVESVPDRGTATDRAGHRSLDSSSTADGQAAAKRHKQGKDADAEQVLKDKLASVWVDVVDDESEAKAFAETVNLFSGEIESLIKSGLDAYQRWENAMREIKVLKEELGAKSAEIERLRSSEESNRSTIQNLFQAAEAAKTEARDISRGALVAASLRADLSATSSKLDEALSQTEEYKRKNVLLEEEILQVKTKLSRVVQEKIKLERDQRMSLSLSKHLNNSSASDLEFYKIQVSELTSRLQRSQAVIDDKNRQIKSLQRQMDRDMSQARLDDLRSESATSSTRR